MTRLLVAAALVLGCSASTPAQDLDGYASIMFDVFLDADVQAEELRTRLFAERRIDLGPRVRITASGFVEGLVGDRGRHGNVATAIVRPQELHAEFLWTAADVRIGFSRVVWGRLDELLPTDVVNPLDLTRFFFEGRVEGRMPVAMIRGRLLPSERFTLEAIYVPVFRRGRLDQLDEETAPFNLAVDLPALPEEPERRWGNAQGGVRASVTTGRVDWSLSGYRGFETLPLYETANTVLLERFPRFTMIGGDFEAVRGEWGVRGEAAFFDRTLQLPGRPVTAEGRSFEMGVGADRKAGDYRISANIMLTRQMSAISGALDDTDATIVASVDRSFAQETRSLRGFAVFNATDQSTFMRLIAAFTLRDNVALEGSGGFFTGSGTDVLSRFRSRDFLYARLKVFF